MEPAFSILHLQDPTTCPYPEPEKSSPCLHSISWKSILILRFHLRLCIRSGLFPSGLPTKILYASLLSPTPAICPDISLFLLWSSEWFSENNTYHTAPHNVAFSTPCYFATLRPRPKHLPQHPILEHSQPMFLPQCERQVSHPCKTQSYFMF